MEKYNNYNPSKTELRELHRIRRKGKVDAENTPELICLNANGFLFWDDDANTLSLSEPYKKYLFNARREFWKKLFWGLLVPIISGLLLFLLTTVITQSLTPAPPA